MIRAGFESVLPGQKSNREVSQFEKLSSIFLLPFSIHSPDLLERSRLYKRHTRAHFRGDRVHHEHNSFMTTKIRTPMFLGGILAALALLLSPAAHAFIRIYMNYEVASANQRFVAEIDYAQDRNDPRVRVHEIREDKRIFKWEAKLFIPISETIHLADDGESIALENYYPYTDQVLYFFHNGKEVRRYALKEVLPAKDVEDFFPIPGLQGKGGDKWNRRNKFTFLSKVGGEPCYCVWFAGETNWVAWTLKDGERISPSVNQQRIWDGEATAVALRVVEEKPSEPNKAEQTRSGQSKLAGSLRPQLPSEDICFKFLGRLKTNDDRKRIESLLTAADYFLSSYGPEEDIVQFRGASQQRARGDRLLAEFDGKLGQPGKRRPFIIGGFYLGGVEGIVQFPEVPKEGSLAITLVPKGNSESWPSKLPVETLVASLPEVHATMKQIMNVTPYKMVPRFGFTFGQILPGEYRVKVLWKKMAIDQGPSSEIKSAPGDLLGESELVTVPAGITSEPEIFKCDRAIVRQ
jgi:hypothetical protein